MAKWRILCEWELPNAQDALNRDLVLSETGWTVSEAPLMRFWVNRRCLVVHERESRLEGFAEASRVMQSKGCPVVLRQSGGSAVVHGPGILNVSMIHPVSDASTLSLQAGYESLRAVAAGLLGVELNFGELRGVYCDGRYNLLAGGRKIGGTAQRIRSVRDARGTGGRIVIAHMSLLVNVDCAAMERVIAEYYALLGEGPEVRTGLAVSLSEIAGYDLSPRGLVEEFLAQGDLSSD